MAERQQQPVVFGPSQQSTSEEIAGASPIAINCTIDETGAVRRRPCLAVSDSVPDTVIDSTGINGLHASATGLILATAVGTDPFPNVYRLTNSGATTLGTYNSAGSGKPTFAETEAIIVILKSEAATRVDVGAPYAVALLAGDPPQGTHVVAHSSRLLINGPDVNGRIWYSSPASGSSTTGHEQWTAVVQAEGRSGFISAESRPDAVVALHENTNEVFAFGQTNLQVFAPDPHRIFSPVTTMEYGCGAAGSIVRDEQNFSWLDNRRRIVYSSGRSVEAIGDPIKSILDDLTTISDTTSFRVLQGPVDALVYSFPTDGVTLAFQKKGGWSQWSAWDDAVNNWTGLDITAATYVQGTGEILVGTGSGKVGKLTRSSSTDFGTRVPFSVTTGFLNHGTDLKKRCISLKLALRRSEGTAVSDDKALLEFRDDLGGWSSPLEVSLGAVGDTSIVVDLRNLGVYRRRQWRFSFHGTDDITLASATEEFEIQAV